MLMICRATTGTYTHFGHDESQADENVIIVNAASPRSETVSYTAVLWTAADALHGNYCHACILGQR